MNLPRLRELVKAGKDGSIRPEELEELWEALPEVLDLALTGFNFKEALRRIQEVEPRVPIIPSRFDP